MESSVEMQAPGYEAVLDELRAIRDALTKKPIPLEKQLWDSHAVADYLGLANATFKNRVACRTDFPRPCDIHKGVSANSSGHRWKASEVIAWSMAQKV